MTTVNVSAWGGRRRRSYDSNPDKPQAFSNSDYYQLIGTVDRLAHTQLGHMYDDFTADELRELFIPEVYRNSLTETYRLHNDVEAHGEVFIDLMKVLPHQVSVFDSLASCIPQKVVLRVKWDRGNMPDGFVTPVPLCGQMNRDGAVPGLRGIPNEELHRKFVDTMQTMTTICGEWAAVKWVLSRLHSELRTPQQVRYVWPAIYTLATAAQLNWAAGISEASARAGNNAKVTADVLPYLKATYEVVARSVLLGIDNTVGEHYRDGQCRLVSSEFQISNGSHNFEISGV